MTVEKGDTIFVSSTNLAAAKELKVTWTQWFKEKSEDYVSCTFTNISRDNEEERIFIQKNMLEQFKRAKKDGAPDFTLVVDGNFQYGQHKARTYRWIVYHDKSHKMYQHRFVQSAIVALGDKAQGMLPDFAKGAESVTAVLKSYTGDSLRDF